MGTGTAEAGQPLYRAASATSANIESLLASVMNWRPTGNFFAPEKSDSPMLNGASPLKLSPGLLDILSES